MADRIAVFDLNVVEHCLASLVLTQASDAYKNLPILSLSLFAFVFFFFFLYGIVGIADTVKCNHNLLILQSIEAY